MILRNIDFSPAQGASGVQGFFGNLEYPEYKHSKIIKSVFGNIFDGMGFVAKTGTTHYNQGNVRMEEDGFSFALFSPPAIYPMPLRGAMLNVVGLSNPGYEALLDKCHWFKRREPFMISFMPIKHSKEERLEETREFAKIIERYSECFEAKFAIQVNFSCPNVDGEQEKLVRESSQILDILSRLNIPLIPKINALLYPELAFEVMKHDAADALCVSNTIPFGENAEWLNHRIDWSKFSTKDGKSPLQKRGFEKGGGLSGKPVFPITCEWLRSAERCEWNKKPIIAGGGVMSKEDVGILAQFKNVEAISIGTVATLRPWRVPSIIKQCYKELTGVY